MTGELKKNYLDQVILRIDFPSTPLEIKDNLPKELLKIILPLFPIPEKKEIVEKGYKIHLKEDKIDLEESNKITEWYYYNKNRKRFICISKKYVFFVYKEWDDHTYEELEGTFNNIVSILYSISDIQITRLGLRYINHVELTESGSPTEWDGYLNDYLVSIFNMVETGTQISRAFQNLELILPEMMIRFQYGMYNPDYPAVIKRKLFVLDYDGYCEYLQDQKEIKDNLSKINVQIGKLFKRSIGPKLEALMKGE